MANTVQVYFQMESLQIVRALNDGNPPFFDRDIFSFSVGQNDLYSTLIPATVISNSASSGDAIPLNFPTQDPYTVQENDVLMLVPLVSCDDIGVASDAEARHNKSVALLLDEATAEWTVGAGAAAAVIAAANVAAGIIAGIVVGAVAAVLQLAKDCLNDPPSPTPRNGIAFAQSVSYTYQQLIGHHVDGSSTVNGVKFAYFSETVPYTGANGSASTLTFKVFVGGEVLFANPGRGPGKVMPRVGGDPSNWISSSGKWADDKSRILLTIASNAGTAPSPLNPMRKMLLYLGSPEAQYRVGAMPSTFSLTSKRPARQLAIEPFVPQSVEGLCGVGSVTVQEGSTPNSADHYKGADAAAWTVPMAVTPYASPIYPLAPTATAPLLRTAGPSASGVALSQGVGRTTVIQNVALSAPGAGVQQGSALMPTSVGIQPLHYADTICLPGGVFLQLYVVRDRSDNRLVWGYLIRYLRYGGSTVVTDVMLSRYMPPLP